MKKFQLTNFVLFISIFWSFVFSASNKPMIETANEDYNFSTSIGRTDNDNLRELLYTSDNKLLLIGSGRGTGDGFGTTNGLVDFWIVKTELDGNIIWEKSYGGSLFDKCFDGIETSDGGFILVGQTQSIDGDVNGNNGGAYTGDGWIVKIDANGNLMWSRNYGTADEDKLESIIKTSDGNYVVSGEIGGTDPNLYDSIDDADFWLIKIDDQGNEIWSKNYPDEGDDDFAKVVEANGQLYLVGITQSTDYSNNHSFRDIAIISLTANGDFLWKKLFGGNSHDETPDVVAVADGLVIAADTRSTVGGDIPSIHSQNSAWVFKINFDGNFIWNKLFGINEIAGARDIISTSDGGFLITGYAQNYPYINRYSYDLLTLKIDALGNFEWANSFGGNGFEYGFAAVELPNGDYVIGAGSTAINGDVTSNAGLQDYWILGLSNPGLICVDNDNDGICQPDDCDDNNPNLPANFGLSCDDNNPLTITDIIQQDGCTCQGIFVGSECLVEVTSANGAITITGLTDDANAKLYDNSIDVVFACNPWNGSACTNDITISSLNAGETYFLGVQSSFCDEWIPITVIGECVDADNDGICAPDDCDDNNPSLPTNPGTICDDNNLSTSNDVILSDGCTCQGTIPCDITAEVSNISCTPNYINFTVQASVIINAGPIWGIFVPIDEFGNTEFQEYVYGQNAVISAYVGNATGPFEFEIIDISPGTEGCVESVTVAACDPDGCNVTSTTANNSINITGLSNAENVKLYDQNIDVVWSCNPWNGNPCTNNEVIPNLSIGTYFLSIQSDNCEEWRPISVSGGNCPDADQDGTCDADDCAPTDASLPAPVGTACNDFNSSTINDVILGDGCTCEGTSIGNGCNITVTETGLGQITVTGLAEVNNVKLFKEPASSVNIVWECNPWSNSCNNTAIIDGLDPNVTHYLSVQKGDCDEWITIYLTTEPINNGSQSFIQNEANLNTKDFSITNLFPNPATNEAFVKVESNFNTNIVLEIYNIVGELQDQTTTNLEKGSNNVELNIADLKTGIYHLVIKDQTGKTTSTRFVKHSN